LIATFKIWKNNYLKIRVTTFNAWSGTWE